MKRKSMCLVWTGMMSLMLCADVIELKDGTRIEGLILAENQDSLEIEIGKNDAGTIRRVLIIHSSEIASWVADQQGRVLRESGAEVNRLGGAAYIERLLRDAEKEIDRGQYDRGIEQFGEAAELAVKHLEAMSTRDKSEALKLRAHALRLQLAALEGKVESIEKRTRGVRGEMEEQEKKLEKEIEDYKKDKADFVEDREKQSIQLGERHKQNDLVKREEELLRKQYLFKERQAAVEKGLAEFEGELIKAQTQIKLTEERVEQAEDDAKAAEREVRRR